MPIQAYCFQSKIDIAPSANIFNITPVSSEWKVALSYRKHLKLNARIIIFIVIIGTGCDINRNNSVLSEAVELETLTR